VRKYHTLTVFFQAAGPYVVIGETFVDGQNRGVWCNSKKPITDLQMYQNGVMPNPSTPSWMIVYYSATGSYLYPITNGDILAGKLGLYDWFFCE
jgi:hypothetical protein